MLWVILDIYGSLIKLSRTEHDIMTRLAERPIQDQQSFLLCKLCLVQTELMCQYQAFVTA